jgi:hypothetical protein
MADALRSLLAEFEDRLVTEIHALVAHAAIDRPAYCLALNYGDDPSRGCIPVLGLGLLLPGESIVPPAGAVPAAEESVWNPAEFSNFGSAALQPRSPELLALDRRLSAAARAGEPVDLRASCNGVAASLNRLSWAPLPVTERFIVYAVDDDLADLSENLAIALAASRS